jgi:hypothetical protein
MSSWIDNPCVRCGYCCFLPWRLIVVNPDKGLSLSNWVCEKNCDKCRYLSGEIPGEMSCDVHDRDWYKHTPCAKHTPECDEKGVCIRGQAMLELFKESGKESWGREDYIQARKKFDIKSCCDIS